MKKTFLLLAFLLAGCTNGDLAKIGALGKAAQITCYSGGKIIYQADSTGAISTEDATDGWYFQEKGTNDLIRVSGQCIIRSK